MSALTAAPLTQNASEIAARFIAWWLVELKTLMPARVQRLAGSKASCLNIDVTQEAFIFSGAKGGEDTPLGRVGRAALTDPDQSAAWVELRGKLSGYDLCTLHCAPEILLVRRLTLPLGLENNLTKAIELQLERLTPFKSEDVLFDARLIARDPAQNQITVDLAVMPKSTVDRITQDLAHFNLKPTELVVTDKENGTAFSFMEEAGAIDFIEHHKISLRLTALCFFLALIFSFALGVKRSREVGFLEELTQNLSAQTSSIAPIQLELDKITQDYQSLSRLRAAPTMSEVLAEFSRVLPGTAFLSQFRLNNRTGHAIGFAKDSSALLVNIDGSELFDKARFGSPITAQGTGGWERFDITFEVAAEVGS